MNSRGLLRAAGLALAAVLGPACGDDVDGDTVTTATVRVSVGPQEEQVVEESLAPSISGDGRWVAFSSAASDLTDNDSNGVIDIFVKDRLTGELENVTNKGFLFLEPGDCETPWISATGRFVAFVSTGKYVDLPSYTNTGRKYVYVFDRQDNVFRAPFASWPDDDSGFPCVSAGGRYLTFNSEATNLGATTGANVSQVYRCDFGANFNSPVLNLVSHPGVATTTGGNGGSVFGRISGDGTRVCFMSNATDLDGADSHAGPDVYLWDSAVSPPVRLISINPSAAVPFRTSAWPVISVDGNFVAYSHRDDANLVPRVIQRYDVAGVTSLPASDPAHTPGTIDFVAISGDGRYVGYVAGTGGFVAQAWRFDMTTSVSEQVSVSSFGDSGNQTSFGVVFSADGVWTCWQTRASNLVAGDTNGVIDVFVRGPSSGF
jgi:hypothetical protein